MEDLDEDLGADSDEDGDMNEGETEEFEDDPPRCLDLVHRPSLITHNA